MPVYNEGEVIAQVVRSWVSALNALNIDYRVLVLNDGSKDDTEEKLEAFSDEPRVEVINKANSGHGPTITLGYRRACEIAEWVFQVDSDDEMSPDHFAKLWCRRDKYDAVFGIRHNREQNFGRSFISAASRLTVRLFFRRGVRDVNVPYRLMRAELLKQVVNAIPDDIFAPNVIISGAFARGGAKLTNIPVPHEGRKTGAVSIVKWKLWKSAFKAFRQSVRHRPRVVVAKGQRLKSRQEG